MQTIADDSELSDAQASAASNLRAQYVVLWSAPAVALILLVLYLSFPGFRPPMSPNMPVNEVAHFYKANRPFVLFSMVGFNLCGILIVPFMVLIMAQMMRTRSQSHIFAFAYLTAVVAGATLFALSNIFFSVAAFRPEQDPNLLQLLNDLAWITFVAPIGMTVGELFLLALAVYFDRARDPVFPRWVGHYALVTAIVMAPAALAAVFKTGPFAWDGFISFWVRNIAYAAFLIVMFFVVRTALARQVRDEGLAA
jgi:hypothetical protein